MGSPDAQHGRQLNGMGGGVSSLSKICVVGSPSEALQSSAEVDVEYTFAQVGIRDSVIDYSGNCGNLSSMVGVFAIDEDMCAPRITQGLRTTATVRTFNTNTNKRIDNTFFVTQTGRRYVPVLDGERASIAGVPGRASPILLDFVAPSGALTGKLLPTGRPQETVTVSLSDSREVTLPVSLVDATNPTVFTSDRGLRSALGIPNDDDENAPIDYAEPGVVDALERVRQAGARLMGLDPLAQTQPKVAVLRPASPDDADADIGVNAFSMGALHRAVPMTVGLCLGVAAACVPRSLAWEAVAGGGGRRRDASELLRIRHPSGVVEVGAELGRDGEVRSARVMRTGRRLMKGLVWW
jgi:hypothetical protein